MEEALSKGVLYMPIYFLWTSVTLNFSFVTFLVFRCQNVGLPLGLPGSSTLHHCSSQSFLSVAIIRVVALVSQCSRDCLSLCKKISLGFRILHFLEKDVASGCYFTAITGIYSKYGPLLHLTKLPRGVFLSYSSRLQLGPWIPSPFRWFFLYFFLTLFNLTIMWHITSSHSFQLCCFP